MILLPPPSKTVVIPFLHGPSRRARVPSGWDGSKGGHLGKNWCGSGGITTPITKDVWSGLQSSQDKERFRKGVSLLQIRELREGDLRRRFKF